MIVRILGEGQLKVDPERLPELNELDSELAAAVEADDDAGFRTVLVQLLARVRAVGSPAPDDLLTVSDVILPSADSTLAEVREMLTDEGLIPG